MVKDFHDVNLRYFSLLCCTMNRLIHCLTCLFIFVPFTKKIIAKAFYSIIDIPHVLSMMLFSKEE